MAVVCGDSKIVCCWGSKQGTRNFDAFCVSGTVERGICIGLKNVGLVGIHSHQGQKNILQEFSGSLKGSTATTAY